VACQGESEHALRLAQLKPSRAGQEAGSSEVSCALNHHLAKLVAICQMIDSGLAVLQGPSRINDWPDLV